MVLGERIGESFSHEVSRLLLLLLLDESQLSVQLLGACTFRREVAEHFRRFKSNSGLPLINDSLAYISVSGPLRTFVNPYKLRFLWNELNFFVRKYLGKTEVVNPSTSRIRKANPESDQDMNASLSGDDTMSFASL